MEEQVIPAEQTADTTADLEAEALAAAPQKRRINRAVLSENLWGWFFVCFLVIGTTLFIYFAFVLSVWLSFVDYRGNGTLWEALGEGNSSGAFYWYQYMFSNTMPGYFGSVAPGGIANFGTTLLNTIFYLIGIPVGMALSLFFAALMSRDIKGSGVFRVIYYIPTVASTVSVALLWENLFGGSTTGGAGGTMVQLFGANFITGDRWMRMLTVLILTTWKGLGGSILLLCAGMNGVNESHKEAASIDGANAWTTFWRISLPQLWPTIFYCIVTSFIGGMQIFVEPQLLYGNGVSDASVMEVTPFVGLIYGNYYTTRYYSYCSALGIVLMIIILLLTLVQFWLDSRRDKV